jgi:hypothetical protein
LSTARPSGLRAIVFDGARLRVRKKTAPGGAVC